MNYDISSNYSDTLTLHYFKKRYRYISDVQKEFIESNWRDIIRAFIYTHNDICKKSVTLFMKHYTLRLKLTRPPEDLK